MTMIEVKVDSALFSLKTMKGALTVIAEATQLDAQDYCECQGQIEAYSEIAKAQIETLNRVITELSEVTPKREA